MRVLYHRGEDRIVFDAIHAVEFYRLNALGTMIKVQNRRDTIYLVVPRIYFDIGTGFVIINTLATKKILRISQNRLKSYRKRRNEV
ncbi:hypothetical protein DXD15_09150 [Blautia sp. TF11-31AT]|nr:hypothetical protein DXD15_09150 [Blautia sp. TF11-31AT]